MILKFQFINPSLNVEIKNSINTSLSSTNLAWEEITVLLNNQYYGRANVIYNFLGSDFFLILIFDNYPQSLKYYEY